MTLPIDPAHLPDVVAQLEQVGVCYYNIGSTGRPFHHTDARYYSERSVPVEWIGLDEQRRHTLTTHCDTCDELGTIDVEPCQDYPDGIDGDEDCDDCDGTGRVSVNVTIPELRTCFDENDPIWLAEDFNLETAIALSLSRSAFNERGDITVVGADPAPGDHIAIIRKVET